VGATPVPVEPDPGTCNLDPARIEAALTDRTRVILPVHLYGQPADMGAIGEIAGRHGVRLLEDAAQAHGARYRGRRVGAIGDVTAWSFYPTKNLGALGDSGAITTSDDAVAGRLRLLRNYGARTKYVNEVKGINSRMEELHAAILRVKLRHLEDWNRKRVEQAARYVRELADTGLRLQSVPEWADPVWHIFSVRTPARDELQRRLADQGVGTLIHYPIPPHLQAAYADMGRPAGSYPIAERIHEQVLSLPIGPQLGVEDQGKVIEAVKNAARGGASDARS
jgi:dTDP-4-amino-4,6-dideoxygalactose transaminase